MPTIKNVGTHLDVLDDGRPLPVEAVVDITDEQIALDHYQTRLADGTLIAVADADTTPSDETAGRARKKTTTPEEQA